MIIYLDSWFQRFQLMVFSSVNSGRMGREIMMKEKHVVEAAQPITDRKLRERQLQPPTGLGYVPLPAFYHLLRVLITNP